MEKTCQVKKLHTLLDDIERIHGLYSPIALGFAAALACCGFTFLLGGGFIEMFCAFVGAGFGNFHRCKLTKHHFTLFLCLYRRFLWPALFMQDFEDWRNAVWHFGYSMRRLYMCHVVYHSGISVFYQWDWTLPSWI